MRKKYKLWQADTVTTKADIESFKKKIYEKREELNHLLIQKDRLDSKVKAKKELAEIEKKLDGLKKQKEKLEALKEALKDYTLVKTDIVMNEINEKLCSVKIVLYEYIKKIKDIGPTFKLAFKQKPIPYLSTSEKVYAGLELSMLVAHLRNLLLPVFVDNCEAITAEDFFSTEGQSFFAYATKDQELSIIAEGELPSVALKEIPVNQEESQDTLFAGFTEDDIEDIGFTDSKIA